VTSRSPRPGVGAPGAAPKVRRRAEPVWDMRGVKANYAFAFSSRFSGAEGRRQSGQPVIQGPCQPPNPATSSSAALGPQDPFR